MKKKTVFRRIFVNNIIIILISFMVLAISGGLVLAGAIKDDTDANVKESATAISGFLDSGVNPQQIETFPKQVEQFLYGISQSSNKSILLVDPEGKIRTVSVRADSFNEDAKAVPMNEIKKVFEGHEVELEGTLGGVYKKKMLTYGFPYRSKHSGQVVGAIIISVPASTIKDAQAGLFGTMLITIGFVILLACVLSYALSRRISRPIREIGGTVKKFAKGDFSTRVDLNRNQCNITEIENLANTFNDMAFRVEKAEDIRNNFISDVSHELRTPMTTIGGFVDGIMDGTIPPEKQNEYLAIVKDEVSRLSALVNSFLNVTRNENAKKELEITHFDIDEAVRRTIINLEERIIDKEISVDIIFETDPCYVKADKNLIKSVLNNLVENAIKFTDKNGNIRIFVTLHQSEVVVSVYNTGCGISVEDKPFIFERFYKGDKSRSRNQQGTGIGLYLVRDVLLRHGKEIQVNSVEGEFAEFTFSLDKGKEPYITED